MPVEALSLPQSMLDSIIQTFINMNASRYTCAGGLVTMLYDNLLTLSMEVDLVWRRKKNFTTVLYLINRYVPLPFVLMFNYQIAGLRPALSNSFCKTEVVVTVLAMGTALTISTWLLSLRVISLWSQQKFVVYSIYCFYAIMQTATWTITIISLHNMYPTIAYYDAVKLCGATSVDILGGAYFAPISFEVYIFSLQVLHHFRRARISRKHNLPSFTLLSTLYHDGYIYFVVVVSLRLMTCLVWATAPGSLWYMSNQLELAMTIALTSRFHLNLRNAATPSNTSLLTSGIITTATILPQNRGSTTQPSHTQGSYLDSIRIWESRTGYSNGNGMDEMRRNDVEMDSREEKEVVLRRWGTESEGTSDQRELKRFKDGLLMVGGDPETQGWVWPNRWSTS